MPHRQTPFVLNKVPPVPLVLLHRVGSVSAS